MRISLAQWRALHDSGGKRMTAKAGPKKRKPVTVKPPTQVYFVWGLGAGQIDIHISGLRLVSEMNAREHWTVKRRRKNSQQRIVCDAFTASVHGMLRRMGTRLEVSLVRFGPRLMDRADNHPAAFKHAIDQIARIVGVDDGDGTIAWKLKQQKGPYGLAIGIRMRPEITIAGMPKFKSPGDYAKISWGKPKGSGRA